MLRRHPVRVFYLVTFILSLFGTWLAFFVFQGSLWVQWIGGFSPALASLVLTGLLEGKDGVSMLLARLFRWKVHWKWYLTILLLPVFFSLVWAFFNALLEDRGFSAG